MEFRQIAGRAGRYGSVYAHGYVTWFIVKSNSTNPKSFDPRDLKIMHKALKAPIKPLKEAGLFPNYEHIAMYQAYNMIDLPFSDLLVRLH